jgi:hypothetical protein
MIKIRQPVKKGKIHFGHLPMSLFWGMQLNVPLCKGGFRGIFKWVTKNPP